MMTDNPIVMSGKFTGGVAQIKSKYANHLINIGGCSLHHISNVVESSPLELYLHNELEELLHVNGTPCSII